VSDIHSAAIIDPEAELGRGVKVGPGALIGAGVRIGDGCEVGAYAILEGPAAIGENCRIFPRAHIGFEPQFIGLEGKGGGVEIGPRTVIREMAMIHRSIHEGEATRLGEECYIMGVAHVAHDCRLGNRVVLANYVALAGHVEIGDDSFISVYVGVHQFQRIGEGSFISAFCPIRKDVPPFTMVEGHSPSVRGLNTVGLRRRGTSGEARRDLKRAYRILFQEAKTMAEGCAQIESELSLGREIRSVLEFVRTSKRGILVGQV